MVQATAEAEITGTANLERELEPIIRYLESGFRTTKGQALDRLAALGLPDDVRQHLAERVGRMTADVRVTLELDRLYVCTQCGRPFPVRRVDGRWAHRFCGDACKNAFYQAPDAPEEASVEKDAPGSTKNPEPVAAEPTPVENPASADKNTPTKKQRVIEFLSGQQWGQSEKKIAQALDLRVAEVRAILTGDGRRFKQTRAGNWKLR